MFSFLRITTPMEPATGRANTVPALLMAGIAMLGVSMAGLMAVSIAAHAEDPVPVEITTVGLVCDGQFEVITGGVDTQAEEMFDGPVHLALAARDGDFVEVRMQAFERGLLMPEEVFTLGGGLAAAGLDMADAGQAGGLMPVVADDSRSMSGMADMIDQDDLMVEITATDIDVMLTQSLESGPVIRARVDGKPLVPTRESIARTDLYLDRISGAVTVNWTDNRVRDHKLPGAIRAAKIQLRDEKIFTGTCKPVAQRTF